MKKSMILVLMVSLVFLSAMAAVQETKECAAPLKMTPEQKTKMQKMCLDFQKEILPHQTDLKAKALDMKALFNEKADLPKINVVIDEMAKIKAEMMKKKLAHHNQMMGLFTEEQKAQLAGCGMGGGSMGCGMMMDSGMHGGMSCGSGCGTMMKGNTHCGPDKGVAHEKSVKHNCKK